MLLSVAQLREEIESVLGDRCEAAFLLRKSPIDMLPSPVGEIPRGTLTEIAGRASSGRTSLLCSLLAEISARQEFCALVDVCDTFDPASAAAAGVPLSHILWVRCGGNVEHAMKAADLLAQGGGFGLIAIDLGDMPVKTVHHIPLAAWFRLRRAVENTRTVLLAISRQPHTQSCAALRIEFGEGNMHWQGCLPGSILDSLDARAQYIRGHRSVPRSFRIAS